MKPQISIIIPVYNVEKYLRKCLDSVIAEDGVEKTEVLVIDDGALDLSGKIADSYAEEYSFLQVIHQKNSGVAAARNTGMYLASGEWLYFVDSDDWIAEGAIGQLLKRCAQCPNSDIILFDAWKNIGYRECGWEHFDEQKVWGCKSEIRRLQRGVLYFPSAGMGTKAPLAAPWDKIYRRKFLVESRIRFPQELKVLDDMVFNLEAFGAAKKVSYFKDRIYHYRLVTDSITNSYKADRTEQDQKVWKYLNGYMNKAFEGDGWKPREKDDFIQAYYCRIIKSFSICCRLSFFNVQNKNSLGDKIRYLKEVLETEPYKTAFCNVKLKNAEWKLKVMICMGRCRFGPGIYLLHLAQSILRQY
mgnify:CR=1 FL=1